MIEINRLANFESYNDPFPVIVIDDFLNNNEAQEATNLLKQNKFDEVVNEGRKNIRMGTEKFKKVTAEENILSNLYHFFNNKDVYENLLNKLELISKKSKKNFVIENKPEIFKKNYYEYKRLINNENLIKKI